MATREPDGDGLTYGSRAGRWVIAASALGSGMASIDATVVGIALPTIGREFHATVAQLQWVVNGYTLSLAALLLVGGSLGDRFGRRRVFTVGVAFRSADRGQAIGAWTGLGGVASAVGPFVGGALIAVASWRWIFVINLPVGLVVLLLAVRHVPESRDPTARARVDVPGAVLVIVALTGVTYGLIEGPANGWHGAGPAGALVTGAVAAVAFVVVESRTSAPLLPLGLFRHRQFSVTTAVTFVVYGALGGVLFLLPVVLQVVGHYTPLASGLALLPLTGVMLLLSSTSGRVAARLGPRLQMSVGPVVVGCGLALLSRIGTDSSYASGVLPAVLVFGLGLAVTVAPLTATALSSAPEQHTGLASAVNNDVARIGGLVAVAVLPALSGISGSAYLHPTELAGGFRTAALVAGAWCVAGGVLAAVGIRNPPRPAPDPDPTAGGTHVPLHHCGLDAPPPVTAR